jgi:hemoglobin
MTADVTTTDLATTEAVTPTLYERIGGRATLERVVPDVIALHLENLIVGERFRAARKPIPELERMAIEFFATGLSGAPTYTGLSMPEVHAGMGITAEEYIAVLDDIVIALDRHGIGNPEQAELLAIAYSMKDQIIGQ